MGGVRANPRPEIFYWRVAFALDAHFASAFRAHACARYRQISINQLFGSAGVDYSHRAAEGNQRWWTPSGRHD
jgi:hypothetical protein